MADIKTIMYTSSQAKKIYHNIICKVPISFEHAFIESDLYCWRVVWKKIKMPNPCMLKGYYFMCLYTGMYSVHKYVFRGNIERGKNSERVSYNKV